MFIPLTQAHRQHHLPLPLLHDLISAFEQDVRNPRYPDRATLLDYCSRSADPVGRLLLHLYGVGDALSLAQSDQICTALQLINFWQDRAEDLRRGRDYLPQGHTLAEELRFARQLMLQGAPLVHRVKGRAGWELRAVVQSGLCILTKLDARVGTADPQQLTRPTLKKFDFIRIFWRCIRM